MKERLPHIVQHLDKTGLPLALLSLPWFLCLFIGYVPLEVSLRILDCFFGVDGPNILFPVGIALFRMNEQLIMMGQEGPTISAQVKEAVYDSDEMLPVRITIVRYGK